MSKVVPEFETILNNDRVVITKYNGKNAVVTVPASIDGKPVWAIGAGAFKKNKKVVEVRLPETLRIIDQEAFGWCSSLEIVDTPEGLTHICIGAFYNCKNLRAVGFGSVRSVGNEAFRGCASLTSIHLPETCKRVEHGAFRGCKSLKKADFPASLSWIEYRAFQDCNNLIDFEKPAGCFIADKAFPKFLDAKLGRIY